MFRRIRKIKIHAGYDAATTDFDIALIEVSQPMDFSSGAVGPICTDQGEDDFTGKLNGLLFQEIGCNDKIFILPDGIVA